MALKLMKGIELTAFITAGVGDFEGHKFSVKRVNFLLNWCPSPSHTHAL